MQELIEQFPIITDDGQPYNVNVYAEVVPTTHLRSGGPTTMHGKLRTYETDEGDHINLREDGSFEIVRLGVIAHRVQ